MESSQNIANIVVILIGAAGTLLLALGTFLKNRADSKKVEAESEAAETNAKLESAREKLELTKLVQAIAEESLERMRTRLASVEKELDEVRKEMRQLTSDNEGLKDAWRDAMAALEQYFQLYSRIRCDLSDPRMRESLEADIHLLEEMRSVHVRVGDGDTSRLDTLLDLKRAQLLQCEALEKNKTITKRSKRP